MFGCFRRMIVLILAVGIAAVAFATRDTWLPRARAVIRAARAPSPGATDPAKPTTVPDTGWALLAAGSAADGKRAVARLAQPRGPAYVSLDAADFAAALLDSLTTQLPSSAERVEVRATGSEFQVRASVKLGDIGGRAVLGPLATMVGERESLTLGGTVEPTSVPGVAQFRLTRVRIGDFAVPGAVVPRLVQAIKRQPARAGVDAAAFSVRLPNGVGDVRVSRGRITLYRSAP